MRWHACSGVADVVVVGVAAIPGGCIAVVVLVVVIVVVVMYFAMVAAAVVENAIGQAMEGGVCCKAR